MSDILVLQNVFKRFNDKYVIDNVSFDLPAGHILSLLGPSGCGKTTTLRCIAGLERPTSGRILIGGKPVVDDGIHLPPERRGIGMVFQSYAVWPHLTVFDNVAFGLRVRKLPRGEIGDRVSRVLHLVGLGGLERRFAHQLSGGQQQRVALARSVVFEPKILLFDEPLSNLDAKLREHMRYELRELLKRLGTTAVYVTHDQAEAMVVSDTIILMQDGRICQSGSGQDLYERPASRFVADFTGAANFIEASVVGREAGSTCVRLATTDNLTLIADLPEVPPAGEQVTLVVRPERISISDKPNGSTNSWPAKLVQQVYLGREYEAVITVGGQTLRALVPRVVSPSAYVSIAPSDLIVLQGE